jgi:DNA modification methylase
MITLHHGDCRDVMATMDAESIDAIVCDPPYGLSFMGKSWDHDVPGVEFWREAIRVAKPGAHLLAFGGTRTFHRLACAIEDAGWEIRDTIMWVHGSGFPKSLDVSKAIDKVNGESGRLLKFTGWMRTTGLTARRINEATGTFMGTHYLTDKTQPSIPTPDLWRKLRPLCGDVPAWVDELVERIEAEREVVGQQRVPQFVWAPGQDNDYSTTTIDITAPATLAARQWQGWGTALKPAMEPVIVARKPLCGSIADNVLRYGTGGINVDGTRIPHGDDVDLSQVQRQGAQLAIYVEGAKPGDVIAKYKPRDRWPSNLIHDGSDEVFDLLGDASRFFYCAKPGKKDRDDGVENNDHPTVKPTELMRYLVRLVTPPGGVVLDPFCGSGSTGRGAILEGKLFIGIDLDEDYLEIARRRINACLIPTLFDKEPTS